MVGKWNGCMSKYTLPSTRCATPEASLHIISFSHICLHQNAVYGDSSALTPGGVRLGSCALTSRGLNEQDFDRVCEFLHRGVKIAEAAVATAGKGLKEWKVAVAADPAVGVLREEVIAFSEKFVMPGRDEY
jgi:glycine hydroxymethyltransferase